MSQTFDVLRKSDLRKLIFAPSSPFVIDSTSLYDIFTGHTYIQDVTPLGPEPLVTRGFPIWFNQLSEFADYIDPVLPRRYSNA